MFIELIINEKWKPIIGFKEYMISDHGRVWSIKNKKLLKRQKRPNGYYKVSLYNEGVKYANVSIHSLVALHFIGERPKGFIINHKDGIKINNYYENLEFITPSENNLHAIELGLFKCIGEDNPASIYTENTIHIICKCIEDGMSQSKIYEVVKERPDILNKVKTIDLIKKIRRGISWRNISKKYNI